MTSPVYLFYFIFYSFFPELAVAPQITPEIQYKPETFADHPSNVSYDAKYDALPYKNKITSPWLKEVNDLARKLSETGDIALVQLDEAICGLPNDMAVFAANELFEFVDLDELEVNHIKLWIK